MWCVIFVFFFCNCNFFVPSLDDTVYLADEIRRQEYILNDIGKIYIGSHSKPKGRQWVYGQVIVK